MMHHMFCGVYGGKKGALSVGVNKIYSGIEGYC
jgi:hypothetical protein